MKTPPRSHFRSGVQLLCKPAILPIPDKSFSQRGIVQFNGYRSHREEIVQIEVFACNSSADLVNYPRHTIWIWRNLRMCFYFGKNALSALAFSGYVKRLCGSNRSSAFFVRGSGCALFIHRRKREWKRESWPVTRLLIGRGTEEEQSFAFRTVLFMIFLSIEAVSMLRGSYLDAKKTCWVCRLFARNLSDMLKDCIH